MQLYPLKCSVTCGSGRRTREVKCGRQEDNNEEVEMVRPQYCQNLPRPTVGLTETCHMVKCPQKTKPYWYTSPWSEVRAKKFILQLSIMYLNTNNQAHWLIRFQTDSFYSLMQYYWNKCFCVDFISPIYLSSRCKLVSVP